jgi:1,4-dihydroxy-2-naphthoyl-CoA synthase
VHTAVAPCSAPFQFSTLDQTERLFRNFRVVKCAEATYTFPTREMWDQVRDWAADPAVALVVMTGEGEKAFCAGGDVVAVVRPVVDFAAVCVYGWVGGGEGGCEFSVGAPCSL